MLEFQCRIVFEGISILQQQLRILETEFQTHGERPKLQKYPSGWGPAEEKVKCFACRSFPKWILIRGHDLDTFGKFSVWIYFDFEIKDTVCPLRDHTLIT